MKKIFILMSVLLLVVTGCSNEHWVKLGSVQINKANVKTITTSFSLKVLDGDNKIYVIAKEEPINDSLIAKVKAGLNEVKGGASSVIYSSFVSVDGMPIKLPKMDACNIKFINDNDLIAYTEVIVKMVKPVQ